MFDNYAQYEYGLAAVQLILAMLGMGVTLRWHDFLSILLRPHRIGFVLVAQYCVFPLIALVIGQLAGLPPGIAVGLVLVAAMPSGSMSNIFTYLGRGNVPLSITATTASMLSCLIFSPLVLRSLASAHLPAEFRMPWGRITFDISFCLLLPLVVGMVVGRLAGSWRRPVATWLVRGSLVALACLVIGSLGSGRIDIRAYGWGIPGVLVLFCVVQVWLTARLARLSRFNGSDRFTVAIEVGLRNCNLAILLKATLFPVSVTASNAVGDGVLFVTLFVGGAALVVTAVPIFIHRASLAVTPSQVAGANRPELQVKEGSEQR